MFAPQHLPSQNAGDDPTSPKETTYSDPSGAIFSMYITRALKVDDENVENWKGGAEGILVFTGLFSSTVATFIAMSYPNLQQDPNLTTQSILAQISQQLSNSTASGTSPASSPPIQNPFSPSAAVVFVNSVWFLSLVLSLTCALIATLLQQWARRYLQIIQRNHAPHVRAHIREYFSRGARKFRIFGLVEMLPFLLLVSVLLFFSGLVVFAFRANQVVAYFTLAIVALFVLSYITLTLMALIFHDCPYQTPLSSLLWSCSQMISFMYFSTFYHGAKQLHERWGLVGKNMVDSYRVWQKNKAKSFSDGRISKLESSAKHLSMDIYKKTLVRTLHWLSEDRELEEFVVGIPGLCESKALATRDDGDTRRTIRDVLAALPGPTSFHASLPWSVIQLAQRALTSKLPKPVQQRRTRACLRALYHIPGAIRHLLAPYAAEKHYFREILPLLNSPESLEIIEELWDTPDVDVALSVRCTAAIVVAFMITPSRRTFEDSVAPNLFIGDGNTGRQFLAKQLRDNADVDRRSDSGRLRNIVRFLTDIKDTLRDINTLWWTSDNADSIRRVRRELFDTRHTEEYRDDPSTFDQKDDRASPVFVPAAQLDLITLTLEILARDPVANAATLQREAFRDAWTQLLQVAFVQPYAQARAQALAQAQTRIPPESDLDALVRIDGPAADSLGMVKLALEAVLQSIPPQIVEMPTPHDDASPSQMPVPHIVSTNDTPSSTYVGSVHRPLPALFQAPPIMLQYSSSAGPDVDHSPV